MPQLVRVMSPRSGLCRCAKATRTLRVPSACGQSTPAATSPQSSVFEQKVAARASCSSSSHPSDPAAGPNQPPAEQQGTKEGPRKLHSRRLCVWLGMPARLQTAVQAPMLTWAQQLLLPQAGKWKQNARLGDICCMKLGALRGPQLWPSGRAVAAMTLPWAQRRASGRGQWVQQHYKAPRPQASLCCSAHPPRDLHVAKCILWPCRFASGKKRSP